MSRRILKWNIPVDDQWHPIGAGPVVHVECQHRRGEVQVWTDERIQDDGKVRVQTGARVYATGQPIPEDVEVLGSAITPNGVQLVWHVVRNRP